MNNSAKYEVKINQFSGPLEKLLELIEAKKLEITVISLGEVTADFLNYLKSLEDDAKHPSVLADFVVVASRLLLIKSKALLPSLELTEEEEKDIKDLESRLKIYKEFKTASLNISQFWNRGEQSFSREFLMDLPPIFYPPKDLKMSGIEKAIKEILKDLQSLVPENKTIKKAVITIEEKVKELIERLSRQAQHSFEDLSKDKPKLEIIVLFLAILHLLRDRLIKVDQNESFSDIIIRQDGPAK